MWKFLLLAVAAYALYRLFMNDRKKRAGESIKEQEHKAASGELVKDPVCGAYVDPHTTVTVREGNVVHHFCSYECRDAYLRNMGALPEKGEHDA